MSYTKFTFKEFRVCVRAVFAFGAGYKLGERYRLGPIGARAVGKVVNDDRADWREAWALFPGSVAYIWHAGTKAGIVQDSLAACGKSRSSACAGRSRIMRRPGRPSTSRSAALARR